MRSFIQNMFAPKPSPIGIDFGSDELRLAQVRQVEGEYVLSCAASMDVPSHAKNDPNARLSFFVEGIRELMADSKFAGRRAVLGLPAAWAHILHLRMPRLEIEARKKALAWEVRGKLPIEPTQALLRHVVAGEVYQDQESRDEVIVVAARKELINQYLATAAKAKLDVVGMNIEPQALVDCFSHLYTRKVDEGAINCFIDIGAIGTRAIITCDGEIMFARTIAIGGDHFTRAVADELKLPFDQARELRIKLAQQSPVLEAPQNSDVTLEHRAATLEASVASDEQSLAVGNACRAPLDKLVGELELCRRYHEATFPNKAIQRLIFVGGEARQRTLCQYIARELGLAAQVGDPMARLGRSEVDPDCGLDTTQPQPAWAVALGLSMGPAAKPVTKTSKASEQSAAEVV